MKTSKKIIPRLFSSVLLFLASFSHAAQYDQKEYEQLLNNANKNGFVSVAITLGHYSLQDIGSNAKSIRESMNAKAEAVLSELGNNVLQGGYSNNGVGQMVAYVNSDGLRILAGSKNAIDFARDTTRGLRIKAVDQDGSIDAVEAVIRKNGYAEINIYLNVDAADYDIGNDGNTEFRPLPGMSDQVEQRLNNLSSKAFSNGINILNKDNDKPVVLADIDANAFYGLIESDDVRAIRLPGHVDTRAAQWPNDVLETAKDQGEVQVTITLRGGDFFSAKTGYMSEAAINAQVSANARAFDDIFSRAGIVSITLQDKASYRLGAMAIKLSLAEVTRLYGNADTRILSITPNIGSKLSLHTSTVQMNMGPAWAAGYTGAGQDIIVLDTGVLKSHVFFQTLTTPYTKVVYEACFGSNMTFGGIAYTSACPNQDGNGDSPLNQSGAGEPYSNATTCSTFIAAGEFVCGHGSHVAGIAAGQTRYPYTLWEGVAPDANIVAVQVGSYSDSPASYNIFNIDILKALQAVYGATTTGTNNPFTVNMSFGGGTPSSTDCDSIDTGITSAIHDLVSRGIPVVVAAGNNASRTGILWPSCVSQAIKVSGVENDLVGNTIYSDGNYSDPSAYTGPFLLAPSGGGSTYVYSATNTSTTALAGVQGTSQAAPHAAGVYADIKAAVPGISVADATSWIVSSGSVQVTFDLGTPNGVQNFRLLRMPF